MAETKCNAIFIFCSRFFVALMAPYRANRRPNANSLTTLDFSALFGRVDCTLVNRVDMDAVLAGGD